MLAAIINRFAWLRHVFADGGYAGPLLRKMLNKIGKWALEIIKRSDTAKGFEVLPRSWVVERTFAWLNRNRRLAKDFENTIESATAWLRGGFRPTHHPTHRDPLRSNRIIISQNLSVRV